MLKNASMQSASSQNFHRNKFFCGRCGFTVVEIAIVLTVIALIVAGVLGGQSAIRSAEIQGFIKEIRFYQDAITNFEDKYQSVPGDMPDARNYWSDASVQNGNGDGNIDWGGGSNPIETLQAWNHLQQADFIDGGLNSSTRTRNLQPGDELPSSNIYDGVGFLVIKGSLATEYFKQNYFRIGSGTHGNRPRFTTGTAAFTPRIAKIIDENLDDGIANSGRLVAGENSYEASDTPGDCSNGTGDSKYNLAQTGKVCGIAMLLDGELLY